MEHRPCPPEKYENCDVYGSEGACREDVHHKYWPKREYKTNLEREFRGLDQNKLFICRALHNNIHRSPPPEKPTRNEMIDAIEDDPRNGRLH